MFASLLRRLSQPQPDRLGADDVQVALAALLVRVARADDTYAEAEARRIDRVLAGQFALSPFAASALRVQGETLEAEAPDTVRFTRALKAAVPVEDRAGLLTALWAVALADGARDQDEESLIRTVVPLLGLSDVDSALARQRAGDAGAAG
jgi:uncharacterized tellurite resistance protein B-like protein